MKVSVRKKQLSNKKVIAKKPLTNLYEMNKSLFFQWTSHCLTLTSPSPPAPTVLLHQGNQAEPDLETVTLTMTRSQPADGEARVCQSVS